MSSRVANGLRALSDFVLHMELKVESTYVDLSEGLICIDGLELKNPPGRAWRSEKLLTAKRIRCHLRLRDFLASRCTRQLWPCTGGPKPWRSCSIPRVAWNARGVSAQRNRPPELKLREDIAVRVQGFVGARANIAAADLIYEDFSEEVGPVKSERAPQDLVEECRQ
eukprot:g28808.t1